MSCFTEYKGKLFKNDKALRSLIVQELRIQKERGIPIAEQPLNPVTIKQDNKSYLAKNIAYEVMFEISKSKRPGEQKQMSTKDIDKLLNEVYEKHMDRAMAEFPMEVEALTDLKDQILGINQYNNAVSSARNYVANELGIPMDKIGSFINEEGDIVQRENSDSDGDSETLEGETAEQTEQSMSTDDNTDPAVQDSESEQLKRHGDSVHQVDMKSSLSRDARMVFSGIKVPMGQGRFSPHEEFLGLNDYIHPKQVLIAFQEILSTGITDMKTLRAAVDKRVAQSPTYAFLDEAMNRLEEQPAIVQNTILSKLNSKKTKMEFVMFQFDSSGGIMKAQVMDANSRNKNIHIQEKFRTRFKQSKLINLEENDSYSLNREVAHKWVDEGEAIKRLLEDYKNSSSAQGMRISLSDVDVNRILKWTSAIGLPLNKNTILDLYMGKNKSLNDNTELLEKFGQRVDNQGRSREGSEDAVFGQILHNVKTALSVDSAMEAKGQKLIITLGAGQTTSVSVGNGYDIELGNLIFHNNNNFLKNLIHVESIHTLTPESSLYIDGKNIYEYVPTNATETILGKIKLDLEKFHSNPNTTIEDIDGYLGDILSLPVVKNNFALQVMIKNQIAADAFNVQTISPEALKKRADGSYNSLDKAKISDLGPKDYMALKMGFFAHKNKEVTYDRDRGERIRMSKMFFSALSDASDLFFAEIPVRMMSYTKDFKKSRVAGASKDITGITGPVITHIKSQLVDGEMERIVSYLTTMHSNPDFVLTSDQNFHSQFFWGLPYLNLIKVKNSQNEDVLLIDRLHAIVKEESSRLAPGESVQIAQVKAIQRINQEMGPTIGRYISKFVKDKKDKLLTKSAEGEYSGEWIDFGIVNKQGDSITSGLIDPDYLKNLHENSNSRPEENIPDDVRLDIAAYDFVINDLVAQSNIQTIFSGDLSNYGKTPDGFELTPDGNFDFYNIYNQNLSQATPEGRVQVNQDRSIQMEKIIMNAAKKLDEDRSKRLKANLSPGTKNANSVNQKYVQLFLQDDSGPSNQLEQIFDVHYPGQKTPEIVETIKNLLIDNTLLQEKLEQPNPDRESINTLKKSIKIHTDALSGYPALEPFMDIMSTDGQEYTTWREHLKTLLDRGAVPGGINFTPEEVDKIYKKIEDYESGSYSDVITFTEREKQIIFQPLKPLHAGHYVEDVNGFKNSVFVYVKSSSFPLIPGLTKGLEIDNLRKKLEQLERKTGKPVRASYNSAVKIGARTNSVSTSLLSRAEDLSDVEIDNLLLSTRELDRDNFYIQQDKPFKADKNIESGTPNMVTRSVQLARSVLSNGISKIKDEIFKPRDILKGNKAGIDTKKDKLSGEDLAKLYDALYKEEQDLKRKQLFDKFNIQDGIWQSDVATMENLQKILMKDAKSPQIVESLELVYRVTDAEGQTREYTKAAIEREGLTPDAALFKVPLWLNSMAMPTETSLNALITNALARLKMPGYASPVGSGHMFKKSLEAELGSDVKSKITYLPGYDPTKGLQYITEKDGSVRSQVMVASKFEYKKKVLDENGNTSYKKVYADLSSDQFSSEDPVTGIRRLDMSKFDADLLEHMSFRIPFSDHGSGTVIEIVGFLPHNQGDLMVIPKEHATQLGEDFDIDVRTVYSYHHDSELDENGELKKIVKLKHKDQSHFVTKKGDRGVLKDYKKEKDAIWSEIDALNLKFNGLYQQKYLQILELRGKKNELKAKRDSEGLTLEEDIELKSIFSQLAELDSTLKRDILKGHRQAEYQTLMEKLTEIENKYSDELSSIYEQKQVERRYTQHRTKVIENNLVDLYKAVYTSNSPEIRSLINKALSTDLVKKTVEKLEAKKAERATAIQTEEGNITTGENQFFSPYDMVHQRNVMESGNSGKLGIGVHSLWVTFNAFIQQLSSVNEDSNSGTLPIDFGFFSEDGTPTINFGGLVGTPELGRKDSLSNADGSNRTTKISDGNMINQNVSMDNQKLLLMTKRNENEFTINVLALMTNLGFITNNHDGSDIDIASLLISQPIIREFVKMKTENKELLSNKYSSDEDIYKKLFAGLQKRSNSDLSAYSTGKTSVDDFLYTTSMNFPELTPEVLLEQAASELHTSNPLAQAKMLHMFRELSHKAQEVSKHQGLLKLASNGTEKSYFKTIYTKAALLKLYTDPEKNSLQGVTKMYGEFEELDTSGMINDFGEYYYPSGNDFAEIKQEVREKGGILLNEEGTGPVVAFYPNNFIAHQMKSVIEAEDEIMGNITPFKNKSVRDIFWQILPDTGMFRKKKEASENFSDIDMYSGKGLEMVYQFMSAMRMYLGTANNSGIYEGRDTESERKRILHKTEDGPSLAGYILELRNIAEDSTHPDHERMRLMFNRLFFNKMDVVINSKGDPDIIKLNGESSSQADNESMYADLMDMFDSEINLPISFKGDENYSEKKFVTDLARYTLLAGSSGGAAGFGSLIPMNIYERTGHNNIMRLFDNMVSSESQEGVFGNFMDFSFEGHLNTFRNALLGQEAFNELLQSGRLNVSHSSEHQLDIIQNAISKLNTSYGKDLFILQDGVIRKNPTLRGTFSQNIIKDQFLRHNPDLIQDLGDISSFVKKHAYQVEAYSGREDITNSFSPSAVDKIVLKDSSVGQLTLKNNDGDPLDLDYFKLDDAIFRRVSGTHNQYERVSKLGMTGSHEYSFISPGQDSSIGKNNSWKKGNRVIKTGNNLRSNIFEEEKSFVEILSDEETSNVNSQLEFLEHDQAGAQFINEMLRLGVLPDGIGAVEFRDDFPEGAHGVFVPNQTRPEDGFSQILYGPKIYLNRESFGPNSKFTKVEQARIFAEEIVHKGATYPIFKYTESKYENGKIVIENKVDVLPNAMKDLVGSFEEANKVMIEAIGKVLYNKTGPLLPVEFKEAEKHFDAIIKRHIVGDTYYIPGSLSQENKQEMIKLANMAYRLTNLDEFTAGLITDKDFRELMSKHSYKGKRFLEKFAEILVDLFQLIGKLGGINNPSISQVGVNAIHSMLIDSTIIKVEKNDGFISLNKQTFSVEKLDAMKAEIDRISKEMSPIMNDTSFLPVDLISNLVDPKNKNTPRMSKILEQITKKC